MESSTRGYFNILTRSQVKKYTIEEAFELYNDFEVISIHVPERNKIILASEQERIVKGE